MSQINTQTDTHSQCHLVPSLAVRHTFLDRQMSDYNPFLGEGVGVMVLKIGLGDIPFELHINFRTLRSLV